MKLTLIDIDPAKADAMLEAFRGTDVDVVCGSIVDHPADAVVSPANSFGFMDGGIDALYTRILGPEVQGHLQERIARSFGGELLVGQATLIVTYAPGKPWACVISAPTMRVPMRIPDPNAVRLATRAAIRCALASDCATVVMPGMGMGSGGVPADIAAREMRKGYDDVMHDIPRFSTWLEHYHDHVGPHLSRVGRL